MSMNKEKPLKSRGIWKKVLLVVILLAATTVIAAMWGKKSSANDYITATIERSNINTNVNATGTLQAITTVQVGSQASGTISWIGADFNTKVKKGEVIARLDPSTLQSQVENARAALQNAEAAEDAARKAYQEQQASVNSALANVEVYRVQRDDARRLAERNRELANVISARDIESSAANAEAANARLLQSSAQVEQARASLASSKSKIDQASAQVRQARATLEQQLVNLDKTVITSPIDGTVVSRTVDVGQTVAASLQAPTLFTIANDLSKMQVLANIDEADVGQIKEGIPATFSVDAFPNETFTGTILQVRLSPIVAQNVVTYNAVINFENPGERLRPGMTANVTVPVEHRENVLVVPNVALRFKPSSDEAKSAWQAKQGTRGNNGGDNGGNQRGERGNGSGERGNGERRGGSRERGPATNGEGQPQANSPNDNSAGKPAVDQPNKEANNQANPADNANANAPGGSRTQSKKQTLWVLDAAGKLEPRRVEVGISDGRVTEIVSGDLKEGEQVVTSQIDTERPASASPTGSPFGGRPGGTGGSRGSSGSRGRGGF